MNQLRRLTWGAGAGLMGGLAGALVLWGSWLLPSLGLILTRSDIYNGMMAMLILGSLGGALYAVFLQERRLPLWGTILSGLTLGLLLWFVGTLILVPVLLGFPPQVGSPLDHWTPLVAFVFHGLIVSLLYSRWGLKQSKARLYAAMGILFAAALTAPVLLRAAVNTDPGSLHLPQGYRVEVVARGFTYPTSLAIDAGENLYVGESGFAYGPKTTEARVLHIDARGKVTEAAAGFDGPINGITVRENWLYVSHRGKVTRVNRATGERKDIITGLPSLGDHQNNDLLFGPDGHLYIGQGSATNSGVVGFDNFIYAWADRYPTVHDIPSRSFILQGQNYESPDLSSPNPAAAKMTGAFAPFGESRHRGERVEGEVLANGVIYRWDPASGEISVYADGLRNPYGLAFAPDGQLYATNLGYDDRGVRAVKNSPDWVVRIREGAWYGWPDFAGAIPLTDRQFATERGMNRNPLIVDPPEVEEPLTVFPPHYSPMKLAFAPPVFGEEGLYVAAFGDGQPLTENLEKQIPTGILLVNPEDGKYRWFMKNREKPRAGRLGDGLKRAIDVKFAESGTMYVLDFGVMEFTDMSPNALPNTGVLWKITPQR